MEKFTDKDTELFCGKMIEVQNKMVPKFLSENNTVDDFGEELLEELLKNYIEELRIRLNFRKK